MKKNYYWLKTVLALGVVNGAMSTAQAETIALPKSALEDSRSAPTVKAKTASPGAKAVEPGDETNDSVFVEKPWYLFLGADAGFSSYSPYDPSLEGTRSGFHGGFRGLLSHYSENRKWVMDGGFGFHFISNSGTNPDATLSTSKVTTRGLYLDLSPRFRMQNNWQIGPELEYWISSDNGLNQNALTDTTLNHGIFLGGQLGYEWESLQSKYRIGGRYLRNMNYTSRAVNVFQIFFELGFSVFDSSSRNEEERPAPQKLPPEEVNDSDYKTGYSSPLDPLPVATPGPENTTWPEPVVSSTPGPEETAPAKKPEAAEKLVLTLDVNDLPFEFDSARLPKYNADRVQEIGRFLGKHTKTWKRLVVEGHTDSRGNKSYNLNLSRARADTVRQLLVEGGAPRNKITAVGYGDRKPKDKHKSEKAYTRNRRVELNFQGVQDVVILKNAIEHREH